MPLARSSSLRYFYSIRFRVTAAFGIFVQYAQLLNPLIDNYLTLTGLADYFSFLVDMHWMLNGLRVAQLFAETKHNQQCHEFLRIIQN